MERRGIEARLLQRRCLAERKTTPCQEKGISRAIGITFAAFSGKAMLLVKQMT